MAAHFAVRASSRPTDKGNRWSLLRATEYRHTVGPYEMFLMKCEVIAVGTELLLGQIVDTNSSYIGEHASKL